MADIFRTMIVPESHQTMAQDLAVTVKPVAGQNMWITGLRAVDLDPAPSAASHFISTGFISPEWEILMPWKTWQKDVDPDTGDVTWTVTASSAGNAAALHGALQELGSPITLEEIEGLFVAADVTDQPPFEAMERMGLKMFDPEEYIPPEEEPV
jgi:hypothetical protein